MVVLAAMVGWVLAAAADRAGTGLINFLVLGGLIVPPAVVPTIWVMQGLGIFDTLPGLVLIEVAFGLVVLRAAVPRLRRRRSRGRLDEAALIDGAGPIRLFFQVAFPLLRSVIVTVDRGAVGRGVQRLRESAVLPPGGENVTVQLTLYNFQSQFYTSWNLLFTDILLITIPPLIMYIFFNRQIVAG